MPIPASTTLLPPVVAHFLHDRLKSGVSIASHNYHLLVQLEYTPAHRYTQMNLHAL